MTDDRQPEKSEFLEDPDQGDLTDEERRFGAAVDELVSAVLALDEEDAFQRADTLAEDVSMEDATELALYLGDWYVAEPDIDGPEVHAVRELFLAVLVRLGMRLRVPEYADPLADAAGVALFEDENPARAAELAARAVALTDDEDIQACAGAYLAIALGVLDDRVGALVAARRADSAASDEFIRLLARAALLAQLDPDDPAAIPLAVEGVRWCHDHPEHLWAVMLADVALRSLLAVVNHHEEARTPPPENVAAELTAALAHPEWTPNPFTHADLAVLAAWANYLRDDLTRLEETLAIAGQGHFSSPELAAHAAMLDVLVPYGKSDIEEMERRLHRAAPVVAAAHDPGITAAFRALADSITVPLRGGSFSDSLRRVHQSTTRVGAANLLLGAAYDAVQAFIKHSTPIPCRIIDEMDAWCALGDSGDAATDVALWALGAVVASLQSDRVTMRERGTRASVLFADLPPGLSQLPWLRTMLDGLNATMEAMADPDAGLNQLAAVHEGHMRAGREFAAFVTATQLSVGHLGRGRRAESLRFGVCALAYLERHRTVLVGSSERHALRTEQELVYATTINAAAGLDDPMVLAELLEYIRAQDMPVVHESPDPTQIPLEALLLATQASGGLLYAADPTHSTDAVHLGAPRPVLMPWGTTALAAWGAPTNEHPVRLVVPRWLNGAGV